MISEDRCTLRYAECYLSASLEQNIKYYKYKVKTTRTFQVSRMLQHHAVIQNNKIRKRLYEKMKTLERQDEWERKHAPLHPVKAISNELKSYLKPRWQQRSLIENNIMTIMVARRRY